MEGKRRIIMKPIKGKLLFDGIFKRSKKIANKTIAAYIVFGGKQKSNNNQSNNNQSNSQAQKIKTLNYAIMVKKRYVKKAVTRNRIKRLCRVATRELFIEMPDEKLLSSIKYIVLTWGKTTDKANDISLLEVKSALAEIFANAKDAASRFINPQNDN